MTAQGAIVATLRQDNFSIGTLAGKDFHGAYYRVALADLTVVLFLPQTGFHIDRRVLAFLRDSSTSQDDAVRFAWRLVEALLAQDCEPVTIMESLA